MQQIADWLEKLGMSEYAERFAENGIGFASLRHLTDQDLKDPNTATAQAKDFRSVGFTDRVLIAPKSGADDFRGCTLGRPDEPRTVWSHRG